MGQLKRCIHSAGLLSVEVLNITVTEWDQIQALERCIMSLVSVLEQVGDEHELTELFQKDMACLLLLREELSDCAGTCTDPKLPN